MEFISRWRYVKPSKMKLQNHLGDSDVGDIVILVT